MFTQRLQSIYLYIFFLLLIVLLIPGCISIGPKFLPYNRKDFNIALQNSDREQLLLNLVRLQYADLPYFLGVANISAQIEVQGRLSATDDVISNPSINLPANLLSVHPSIQLREKPTISYVPLQGEEFTRQLLAPIKMEYIYLLLQSGWSIERVLRITTQNFNEVLNAPASARPSTKHIPQYKDFVEVTHYLREWQRENLIKIYAGRKNETTSINIALKNTPKFAKERKKLLALLKIRPIANTVQLMEQEQADKKSNVISVQTRSVLGMLYYLSKSVEVDPRDMRNGVVDFPCAAGRCFDWSQVTKGIMKIHASTSRPNCAFVAVFYRNHWYYIADNDPDSKETLSLITFIFALQAGTVKGNAPLLTLPV